jgi:hypothetical protein
VELWKRREGKPPEHLKQRTTGARGPGARGGGASATVGSGGVGGRGAGRSERAWEWRRCGARGRRTRGRVRWRGAPMGVRLVAPPRLVFRTARPCR